MNNNLDGRRTYTFLDIYNIYYIKCFNMLIKKEINTKCNMGR